MQEMGGRPNTGLPRFYTRKSQWKRKMNRVFKHVETTLNRIRLKQITPMGELYSQGHRLKDVATLGYELIVQGSKLRVEERVYRDIVRVMKLAQTYSETLKGRCEALDYPTRTFPIFTCEVQLPDNGKEEHSDTLAEARLQNILGG